MRTKHFNLKAIILGLALLGLILFLAVPSAKSGTSPGSTEDEPSPPRITCYKRCHIKLGDRLKDIYSASECTSCHGSLEEHRQARSLIQKAQLSQYIPNPSSKPETEKIYVARNPQRGLMQLKGRPMKPSSSTVSPPAGMVYIPAGEFIMGSNERWEDESPEYVVYTPAFFIDKYEVTNTQYKEFIEATGHKPPKHWENNTYPEGQGNYPVVYVTWQDAVAYAKWAGKRLPTEEEWEKASRGTDGRTYPWGIVFDPEKSNNPQKDSTGAEAVGSYEAGKSPYGLYDMSGNVWEWVDAWYSPHPGNNTPSEEYDQKYKLAKGGSWFNCLFYNCSISAPTYNRAFFLPSTRNASLGFRCVKDVDESSSEEVKISLNLTPDLFTRTQRKRR